MRAVTWYFSKSEEKHLTQIIVQLPPENEISPATDSKLIADPGFMGANWAAAALIRSDSQTPAIFAKASRVADMVQGNLAKVAFGFYHLNHGGILQIFISVDSPELERSYLSEYPMWLSDEKDLQTSEALLSNQKVQLFFVAPDQNNRCRGYFGLEGELPADCAQALKREWQSLHRHHKGVANPDFDLCIKQYNSENPLEESPILKESSPQTSAPISEDGYGLTDRDIIELWQHGIRKVGDIEINSGMYEMALTSLELGGSGEMTPLARDLIRQKESRIPSKTPKKIAKHKKSKAISSPSAISVETWRLVIVPAALTLAFNLVVLIGFRWPLPTYALVNSCFVLGASIYFAYRLYRAGEWPPAKSKNTNPREELLGCVGGLIVLGVVLGILAGAVKVRQQIIAPVAISSMVVYALLQSVVYRRLFKITFLYTCLARVPEIIISLLFLPEDSEIRFKNIAGFSAGSLMYGTWFGMITTAILDWRGEKQKSADEQQRQTSGREPVPRQATASPPPQNDPKDFYLRAIKLFEQQKYDEAEATLSRLLTAHPKSEEGRKLWKRIRKAQGKEITLDLTENKKIEIYREYKQACDRAFVQKYLPQRPQRHDLDFAELVAEMNRIGGEATTEVRKNILKKYDISEFDLNLILQEGERNAWPVKDS